MKWYDAYDRVTTCDPRSEQDFIIRAPLTIDDETTPPVTLFATRPPVKVDRINKVELHAALGRCSLVRILSALEQLDEHVSRVLRVAPAAIKVHCNLYGSDEMAHCPEYPSRWSCGPFISLNLAERRLRSLLYGVAAKDATATSAITDLLVHERAHLLISERTGASSGDHGQEFYEAKAEVKRALVGTLHQRPTRDPFRRSRFSCASLPTAADLAAALPHRVVTT